MSKIALRTLRIFELFAEVKRPLGLTELANRMDIAPSSAHDILKTLRGAGYIYEFSERGGYYPTMKMVRVFEPIVENDPLHDRVEPFLRELRDRFDESVSLSRIQGLSATYVLVFPSRQDLRIEPLVGNPIRSIHATSAGKALLSTLPRDELKAVVSKLDMTPLTDRSIRDPETLIKEVLASVEDGIFINREESVPGVTTYSTLTNWANVNYVLTMAIPTARKSKNEGEIIAAMRRCADAMRG